jgi:hypothetical protein
METGATADLTLARKAAEGGEVARLLGRTYKATESLRMLAALPSNTISAEQRTALLAASVMQAEGEHDDVYRHLLREVRGPGGDLVAFIGVTYDVNLAIGAPPSAAWVLLLAGWLLGMGAYWLSLPAGVWLDVRARGERAWVWGVFVLLGNLVALITYILARRPHLQAASANPGLAEAGNRHPFCKPPLSGESGGLSQAVALQHGAKTGPLRDEVAVVGS